MIWTAVILILLPVLLITAVLLALRSETGTAWVIDQIPGLDVSAGNGSLFGEWRAERLKWQGYGVFVQAEEPYIDWSPSCLFNKQLCLDSLNLRALVITTLPSEGSEKGNEGIDLPDVDLPIALRIGNVNLGPFVLNGSPVWDSVELSAQGSGSEWQLDKVAYRLGDLGVTARGRVTTRRDWPLDLHVSADIPPPSGENWNIDLSLAGSIRDLRVTGQSVGYLNATLSGRVSPLDPTLPAELRLTSSEFLALDTLPATLTLQNWTVDAKGSLESGFRTRTQATLPGTTGPIGLSVRGLVTTGGARDLSISLDEKAVEGQPGSVRLEGNVDWLQGLKAETGVSLQAFPWYSLLPDMAEPPVILETLSGNASWDNGVYHAGLTADVNGPQGRANVAAVINGDLEEASLTDLKVTTGAGALTGNGSVNFAGPLSWQAALALENFNPGYWVPILEANLSGSVETRGALRGEAIPDMLANWAVAGTWQGKPAVAEGNLDTSSGQWEVSDLAVSVGDNRISGKGAWGRTLFADFDVFLPSPGDLVAGLAGSVSATLKASGTPEQPDGTLTLKGRNLGWQDSVDAESLDLTAELQPGFHLDSQLQVRGLSAAGQRLESIMLEAKGTQENHTLTLEADHEGASLELAFAGGFDSVWAAWSGSLERGVIDVPGQNQLWELAEPATLDYPFGKELLFGAHCWRWSESSVCAGDQILLPEPRITYRISNFPTEALAPLFPETVQWKAMINGDVDLAVTPSGPDGHLSLDAGEGEFRVLLDGEWQSLVHKTLSSTVTLKPDNADMQLLLSGPELGQLAVDLSVDPRTPQRNVEGTFSLNGFDFALVGLLSGLQEVAGEISGEGRLAGPLMKPSVVGQLALTGGRVVDHRLPVPVEEAVASIDLKGYSADLSARIKSNARSQTILDGTVNWQGKPEAELRVSGERIPFALEPYASIELAPDLTISLRENDLSISGQVEVPRGSIEIKGLPAQAVSVSDDEVIVGVEKEEPVIRQLNMDVTVIVGEDQVTFAAFGVEGDLEGTIRIGNDMETRGTLQLVNGQYEAFGQELELRRARLVFVGNLTQPYLDIEAVRTVDAVVAGIRLSGPVQSPTSEVFSEPDMPQTDALSYVILGRAPQTQGDEGQMSRAALALGLTQASRFTGDIGEEFGIQNLMLEAEGSGEETSVVASGYLTDELSVRYGVGIFEPITTVALRYDLGRYFYLEAASGLAASLDIFYTRDF
ncbi:translocation/assembly module TamB [Marinobacter salinexigens]|uniref:Translocation/assembly module TamB n=1 Tax=Marinobacter salinexigens TaxID=2919747 RepID=A0A5B0VKI4_9GAMM|nr:translocation/assembly module TamB [Marinobacter salinexigens]